MAYNGQFDIKGMVRTARSVGADEDIISAFEYKMVNGGLIDVLGLARQRINNKIVDRLALASSDPEKRELEALRMLFSPEELSKTRLPGEALKGFGLENIIQSSNFLENLAQEAEAGDSFAKELLDQLFGGQASHVDRTDRMVAEKALEYLSGDKLDLRYGLDISSLGLSDDVLTQIDQIRLNVASSRAIVPVTNLADPRYLTQTVYKMFEDTAGQAIRGVEVDVGTDYLIDKGFLSKSDIDFTFGSETKSLRLKFDPKTGSFRFFGLSKSGTTLTQASVMYRDPSGKTAQEFIKDELDRVRGIGVDSPLFSVTKRSSSGKLITQPVIQTLGITPIKQTNIENVGRIARLITPSRTNFVNSRFGWINNVANRQYF